MGFYYLETSALVKLYVREPGSDKMLSLTAISMKNRLTVLSLVRIELRSAVRRREREKDIPSADAEAILDRFEQHLESKFLIQPVSETVIGEAGPLVDRHALRAYDAVQLAGCLVLRGKTGPDPPTFVSADRALLDAARAEGLVVVDPSA